MTDFFNPENFKGHEVKEANCGECHKFWNCGGCHKFWRECSAPLNLQKEFQAMTGLNWKDASPAGQLVTFPLRKDYSSLGLDTTDIPNLLPLCLPCILDYMKTFNRLLHERKEREKQVQLRKRKDQRKAQRKNRKKR